LLKSELKANLAVEKSVEIGLLLYRQFQGITRREGVSFARLSITAIFSVS